MTFWVAGAVIGGSVINAYSANKAGKEQSKSAGRANDVQLQMFNKQNELNAPFRENGLAGQNRLMDLLGLSKNTGADGYGSMNKQFGAGDFNADPGYQWRLAQGQKGIDRSMAARGGLLSGAAVKASADYNQGAASQEYGNAYNRFQTDRSNILNPLQSLAGMGQTATGQMQQSAQNYGNNVGNNLMGAGNARASGYMGMGNALSNGISQGANLYQSNQLMNKLFMGSPPASAQTGNAAFIGPY